MCSLPETDYTKKVREDTPEKTRKQGGSSQKRIGRNGKPGGLDVSKALEPLNGKCATLHHEYWSYTWCHRGTVMQASLVSPHADEVRTEQYVLNVINGD